MCRRKLGKVNGKVQRERGRRKGRGWKRKWGIGTTSNTILLSPTERRGVSAPEATSNSL